ncbi:MAG: hypothetical protein Q4D41_05520 [Prevotellaceae bacterium]|nr:hypothetical protein [Prevotellaceae bacterium]
MEANNSTITQIERFIRKIAQKFPDTDEPSIMTDIHISVSQDSGELLAFDDDDNEITRCVVDQWINSQEPNFYNSVASILRHELERLNDVSDNICVLKPYSFILENDEREHYSELYIVDSDIKIIGGDLMEGLEDDLDNFFKKLIE